MPNYVREVGRGRRVAVSGATTITGNLSVIGLSVAGALTAQVVTLFEGTGTSVILLGTGTMLANTFYAVPAMCSGGLTIVVTNEDVDLTIYWNPEGRT